MEMERPTSIAVIETTAIVTDSTSTMRSLQLLNIIVHTDSYVLSLVRYIPDLIEFDQLIKCHYHKVKIQFPTLSEPKNQKTSRTKRRSSIRQLFTSLSSQHHGHSKRKKTNSEKVEKYLNQCLQDPIIRQSTILRDFLSIQRDEDQKLPTKPLTTIPHMNNNNNNHYSSISSTSSSDSSSKSLENTVVVQKQKQQDPIQNCTTSVSQDDGNNNNFIDHSIITPSTTVGSHSLDKLMKDDKNQQDESTEMNTDDNDDDQQVIITPTNDKNNNDHDHNDDDVNKNNNNEITTDITISSPIDEPRRLSVKDDLVALDDLLGKNQSVPSLPVSVDEPVQEVTIEKYNTSAIFPLDYFEMITVLGKGCMGKVFLVKSNINHQLYALKSIVKELVIEQREITHSLTEREILATLADIQHPNLAKLYLAFQDIHRLYLVTDYYCGGDLATQMSTCMTFSKERTRFYAAEMIEGIGELHRLGILYRDLKPENILLTREGHVVLTDFGLSKWLVNTDYTETFCGTAEYLAPEVLTGDPYSFGIDHWSYGTILYEMLAGITPFWADNHMEMYRRVLEDPLEFPMPDENGLPEFDYETVDFLTAILDRNSTTRLGAGSVQEIKSHAYFAGISWDDVYQQKLKPPYIPSLSSQTDFSNFDAAFLEMPTILTPMASQVNLTNDMQDVFEDYSFNDNKLLPKSKSLVKLDTIQQVEEDDENDDIRIISDNEKIIEVDDDDEHVADDDQMDNHTVEINLTTDDMMIDEVHNDNNYGDDHDHDQLSINSHSQQHEQQQTTSNIDLVVEQSIDNNHNHNHNNEKQKTSPKFQPARKRGSISLLSEVDSFQLDSPLIHNDHDRTVKRRNTHDDIIFESTPKSMIDASSSTTTTDDNMDDSLHTSSYVPDTQFLSKDPYDHHHHHLFDPHNHHEQHQLQQEKENQHNQDLQTESDINLDFEGPDLDLRFSLEVDQKQQPGFSTNTTAIPSTKPKKRKYSTRKLLSPFIRF